MRQKGWILGENLLREATYTDGRFDDLARLAEKLVRKRVDVILTFDDQTTVAVARATRTIPIVFVGSAFLVERGLIDSDARPGRNVTGVTIYPGSEIGYKRLGFLREPVPTAKRLSWIADTSWYSLETVAGGRFDLPAVLEADAKRLGFETRFHVFRTPQDVDVVFGDIVAWRAQAVLAYDLPASARPHVAELLLRHRLPSAFYVRENVEAGGLLSYGAAARTESGYFTARLADYIDRILRGTPPAELPVERQRRYELVLNMKTANALGLTIPQSLLLRADEVIQ